jgi:hypothetical protein
VVVVRPKGEEKGAVTGAADAAAKDGDKKK